MMLIDHAGLPAEELAQLRARVDGHSTLGDVVRGWAAERPPRLIVEVITQDEYTHDVVVPYRGEIHLVYDTT